MNLDALGYAWISFDKLECILTRFDDLGHAQTSSVWISFDQLGTATGLDILGQVGPIWISLDQLGKLRVSLDELGFDSIILVSFE